MLHDRLLPVNTAPHTKSIWRDLAQDKFRRNVVALQRASNELPGDPAVHSWNDWSVPRIRHDSPSYILPFSIEQRLADDFAFMVAAEEGSKAVSAMGLEQDIVHQGMVVRLVANGTIPEDAPQTIGMMFELLVRCAGKSGYSMLVVTGIRAHALNS